MNEQGAVFGVPEEMEDLGGGGDWLPKGDYQFTIAAITEFPLGDDDGEPFIGFATTEGEQISVRVNELVPLNGADPAPSETSSTFIKLVLVDGDETFVTVDPSSETHDKLAKSKRRLVGLAHALGETPSEGFVQSLRDGDFDGQSACADFRIWKTPTNTGNWTARFWASTTI